MLESLVKIPTYSVAGFTHGRVVYVSTAEGVISLWSLNPATREVRRLTRNPVHSVAPAHRKSRYVAFTRDVTRGMELHKPFIVNVETGGEELLADVPPMRIFGLVWDGVRERLIFSAATRSGIGLFMAWRGGYEKLLDVNAIVEPTDIDGDLVAGFGMLKGNPLSMELFTYDIGSGEFKVYTPKEGSVNKAPALHGGKLLFESNFEGSNALYVYDVRTEELGKPEMEGGDYSRFAPVENSVYGWTPDGRVWAVGEREGRSKPFVDGHEVPSPGGTVGYLALSDDSSRAYYSASSLTSPPKIYEADLRGGSYRVLLDNPLPEELRGRIGKSYFIKCRSADGLEVPTFVVESPHAGRPGPTVVYVHGGPWSEVMDAWSVLINSLVVSGYHVIAPNFRGSTGYGEDFRLKDIGDPGGGDLEDVVAAARWGVESGLASDVGIVGYSYGGYMTYLALGRKPELWRAGVAGAGIVDWRELYELSDALFRKFIETLFGGIKEGLMVERSPITYVRNVRAPLCIIHPQNDSRTPLKPVLRYVEELLKRGVTFEAHVLPDMGHAAKTVDDIVRVVLPTVLFLDRYLKPAQS